MTQISWLMVRFHNSPVVGIIHQNTWIHLSKKNWPKRMIFIIDFLFRCLLFHQYMYACKIHRLRYNEKNAWFWKWPTPRNNPNIQIFYSTSFWLWPYSFCSETSKVIFGLYNKIWRLFKFLLEVAMHDIPGMKNLISFQMYSSSMELQALP